MDGAGTVTAIRSNTTTTLSVPPEFKGPGNGSNPEELLTEALVACYSVTFGIIAANRKIPVASVEVDGVGYVEQAGMQLVYKAITIRPVITLSADASEEQVKLAEDMSHKADLYCLITNAVRDKVAVTVEPTIKVG